MGKRKGYGITRREFLATGAGAGAGLFVLGLGTPRLGVAEAQAGDLVDLEIFQNEFPRAFFYRQSEDLATILPYDEWERKFSGLNGILGKIVEEEKPDTTGPRNVEYFTRFKERNPEQLVMLHYNGWARLPEFDPYGLFFGGHWLYQAGTNLTQAVAGNADATVLHVADTSVFSMGIASGTRFIPAEGYNDDIGAAVIGGDGRPDWQRSEQLRLVSIDEENRTITVERGSYGTQPIELPEGSYLAAHIYGERPFSAGANLVWGINLSPDGPRDAHGRNGIDVFVEDMARRMEPDGILSPLDGLVLDVFQFTPRFEEALDINNDGEVDKGFIGGINVYGLGQIEAMRRVRERLPDKLIITDGGNFPVGQYKLNQRPSYEELNGIEKEGFPLQQDLTFSQWSTVYNTYDFWKRNAQQPTLSFINHKRNRSDSYPINYADWRLVFAATQLAGIGITYFIEPGGGALQAADGVDAQNGAPPELFDREIAVFDELWQGVEHRSGWLGAPVGEAVHLAERSLDLLRAQGRAWSPRFVARFEGEEGARFERLTGGGTRGLRVSFAGDDDAEDVSTREFATAKEGKRFTLPGIDVPGEDLFLSLTLRADPVDDYPASIGRILRVTVRPSGSEGEGQTLFTHANQESFVAAFYFRDVGPGLVDIDFLAEGGRPVVFERLTAHSAADAMYREFENGAVFANPSGRPYTFDVRRLSRGASFRRIQGTEDQDPETNNGQPLERELALGPTDGLAVLREHHAPRRPGGPGGPPSGPPPGRTRPPHGPRRGGRGRRGGQEGQGRDRGNN